MREQPEPIEPGRIYPFAEVAALIPSPRAGAATHPKTLHRWRREGRLECFCRMSRGRRYWFAWGSSVLAFLDAGKPPEWHGRTPAARRRDIAAAEEEARRLGILK